ncbi:MAG TPA: hypothetical protein VNI02_00445 [Blastocatellia bacterium]|nr:hypothetical protein [Blastocatellia bacterium]
MSLIKGLQRRRLMAVALAVACLVVGGAVIWRASRLPAEASSKDKQNLQERLHKGVGSEVRFASADASPEQIEEAVKSTDDFIYWRSGLKMSDKTRKDLAKAESDVLKGKAKHITLGELTDSLTGAVVDRLATLTDEEILLAAEASSDESGEIQPRANGKWGDLTKQELIRQAQSGREWSQRGDSALRAWLRPMIEEEVNDRAAALGAALPKQFGRAGAQGVTPTQALLIGYSVAADDLLTDSRSDIEQEIVQKRMDARQTREQKAQKGVSGRPYGPRGMVHPSAAHLFFNRDAVDKLLNLSEGGKK